MEIIGSIFILLAILLPVLAYLAQPMVTGQAVAVSRRDRRLSTLEAERERLLSLIQEMDLDYSMGKIAREDYDADRAIKLAQTADVLRQVDALTGSKGALPLGVADAVDGQLEAELEARVAKMRQAQGEKALRYCAKCGGQILGSDRFCSECGSEVEPEEMT
jgi:hypothetical protein